MSEELEVNEPELDIDENEINEVEEELDIPNVEEAESLLNEEEIPKEEIERRDAQSWKDKAYATEQKMEQRIQELESKLVIQQQAISNPDVTPKQEVVVDPTTLLGTDKDPIVAELDNYSKELNDLVDSGSIDEKDAILRYREQYQIRANSLHQKKEMQGVNAMVSTQTGRNNISEIRKILRQSGVAANDPVEKEVFKLLKADSGFDWKNPSTFSNLNPNGIATMTKYAAAVARENTKGKAKPVKQTPKIVKQQGTTGISNTKNNDIMTPDRFREKYST